MVQACTELSAAYANYATTLPVDRVWTGPFSTWAAVDNCIHAQIFVPPCFWSVMIMHQIDTLHLLLTDAASPQKADNIPAIGVAGWGRLSASLDIHAQRCMHFQTLIICSVGCFSKGMIQIVLCAAGKPISEADSCS